MIDLTKLTDNDRGRGVVYVPRVGPREDGIIVRWNDTIVFVDYRGEIKATYPADLEWP